MASLILENAPGVILNYQGRKKNGAATTEKIVEFELNLKDPKLIASLDSLFPNLEGRLEDIETAEAGPEDMTCRSAIGDCSLVVVAAQNMKTEVLRIDVAKAKTKMKLHVGAKAETLRARLKFVGSLAPNHLPRVDDFTGVDVFFTLKSLQADINDGNKPGGRAKNKGSRPAQIKLADGSTADVEPGKKDRAAG
jgi:hypothetical protein